MIFVDTNVFFAAAVRSDGSHSRAARLLGGLKGEQQLTSDHVLVETWNLIAVRRGRDAAMAFWNALRGTPIAIEPVGSTDLERALAIAETWPDQDFDIVDCTSFAVMERTGCNRVATFDSYFAIYRTGPNRKTAFEVVNV